MEYIYAAMLLNKAKQEINEESVQKVLEAAGVKADTARIKALVAALEGIDIENAIKESMVVAPVATATPSAEGQVPAEEKKEEKKEEETKSTEEAAAGLGSLFG